MGKGILKVGGVILAALFISSCAMRTYVQDKGRVDQEIVGNAGCIQGTCPPVDRSNLPKTRKTYVLEIVTGPHKIDAAGTSEDQMTSDFENDEDYTSSESSDDYAGSRALSRTAVINEEPVSEVMFTEYTIQEGDTLQKISKKFYDTYRRWNEIYEANKDVISSPDRIKPGKVIRIPEK